MPDPGRPQTRQGALLVFTQTYDPDPAAVGQYLTDVSRAMVRRGYRVIVYTANSGYDDPTVTYPSKEFRDGVEVRRLGWVSVGKDKFIKRLLGASWFTFRSLLAALTTESVSGILVSTSPPLIGIVAVIARRIRRIPYAYWVMDINPDQLIALGRLSRGHPLARVLRAVGHAIAREAALVVALDHFMVERLGPSESRRGKLLVLPPWPRDPEPAATTREANPFRARHGWGNDLVLLYSGNHTPSNPLDSFLEAARRLAGEPGVRFVFIGGGAGKRQLARTLSVDELPNVSSLPYQPSEELKWSLPAGDVHLASLGDNMVGIIHPSKVYSAMAAGRPILYVGPAPSHITDLLDQHDFGWHLPHNDIDGLVETIRLIVRLGPAQLDAMGNRGRVAVETRFNRETQCGRFCDALEREVFEVPARRRVTRASEYVTHSPTLQ